MEAEKKPKQSFKTVVLDPMGGITHERICKELNSVDYVEIGVVAGAGTSVIKAERFTVDNWCTVQQNGARMKKHELDKSFESHWGDNSFVDRSS